MHSWVVLIILAVLEIHNPVLVEIGPKQEKRNLKFREDTCFPSWENYHLRESSQPDKSNMLLPLLGPSTPTAADTRAGRINLNINSIDAKVSTCGMRLMTFVLLLFLF